MIIFQFLIAVVGQRNPLKINAIVAHSSGSKERGVWSWTRWCDSDWCVLCMTLESSLETLAMSLWHCVTVCVIVTAWHWPGLNYHAGTRLLLSSSWTLLICWVSETINSETICLQAQAKNPGTFTDQSCLPVVFTSFTWLAACFFGLNLKTISKWNKGIDHEYSSSGLSISL